MPIKTWKYEWNLEFEQYFDQHFLKWHVGEEDSLRLHIVHFGFIRQGSPVTWSKGWSHPQGPEVQHDTKYTQLLKLDLTSTHLIKKQPTAK